MKHAELIARLEAAEVGSRELDGEVWFAAFEPDVDHGGLDVQQTEQGPREYLVCELGVKDAVDVANYTTSLDAALALAERVLPGWVYMLVNDYCRYYRAELVRPESLMVSGSASTMPLSLCIAILRALDSQADNA